MNFQSKSVKIRIRYAKIDDWTRKIDLICLVEVIFDKSQRFLMPKRDFWRYKRSETKNLWNFNVLIVSKVIKQRIGDENLSKTVSVR